MGSHLDRIEILTGTVMSSTSRRLPRTTTLAEGTELEEEIITNDSDLRRLQYRITKGMPLDFHLATVDVLEDGVGALVIYSSDVEPDEVADAMGPLFESGLDGLKARLEQETRGPDRQGARRLATSTPAFDTQNGTRYVTPALTHTPVVASPRKTTSSWLMQNRIVPTASAIRTVFLRCGG
jgi:hypothetical protein